MAYIICEPCAGPGGKDSTCVEVCPVDCIHPKPKKAGGDDMSQALFDAETQLYIDPDVCIDCGACVPVCPVEAIFPESEVPPQWESYIQLNADFFKV